jgi:DHA1 family bicyclomycin/chloramphenicol resistance-like MFS transporter
MLVVGVAPVCAPLFGAQLLRLMSWRGLFFVLAGIGVALLVVTARWLQETLPRERRRNPGLFGTVRMFGTLLRDRRFVPYAATFALSTSAMFAYIAGSSFVLEETYGVSPQVFGVVFAVNASALVMSAQLSGRLVGRTGPHALLATGVAINAAAGGLLLVAALAHAPLALLLVGMVALVGSIGLISPNATALALAHQGHAAGSASAVLGLGQRLLGAAVMPLAGLAGTATALPMAATIAGCSFGALAVYLLACRANR